MPQATNGTVTGDKIGYPFRYSRIFLTETGVFIMPIKRFCLLKLLGMLVFATVAVAEPTTVPMKFNEVKEIAPGVFFRYSSISATDKSVPFGGSNHVWVVFEDFVAVIDANFPDGAEDVVKAIRKTTNKPIRYVFDTHHHGDHAYGNSVFFREGASVVAQAQCARLMNKYGLREFKEAGEGPTGRKDVANSFLKAPAVVFDDRLVLEDGKQRVEFLYLAHGHTAGDAVAWMPKHGILCTGDACVNGAYNFMGHSDSSSWVNALEKMKKLKPKMICPGHGPIDGPQLVERQQRFFVELRNEVSKGIKEGKSMKQLQDSIKMPWYKDWTGVDVKPDNVEHVFKEFTGEAVPHDLIRELGYVSGDYVAEKPKEGWVAPKRILVSTGYMPDQIAALKIVAPEVEFVPVANAEEAAKLAMDADAVLGFATEEILKNGKKLRWIQTSSQGTTEKVIKDAGVAKVQVTSLARAERVNPVTGKKPSGPEVMDRKWRLMRENVRRFATGQPLLAMVEKP